MQKTKFRILLRYGSEIRIADPDPANNSRSNRIRSDTQVLIVVTWVPLVEASASCLFLSGSARLRLLRVGTATCYKQKHNRNRIEIEQKQNGNTIEKE